jgi:ABC-type sugar transport system permease subunit
LLFALVTSVGKVGFGLILALALTQRLHTGNLLRSVFYMPCILSMVVIGLVMKSVLRYDGMLNHIMMGLGLFQEPLDWLGTPGVSLWCTMAAEIWRWSGFTMAIFIAGLAFPDEAALGAAKLAVLLASATAGVLGLAAGRVLLPKAPAPAVAAVTVDEAEASTED